MAQGVETGLYTHPAVQQLPYGHGRDYSKGFTTETHDDKINKLGSFIVEKMNHSVQDARLGVERVSELYNLDAMIVAEPQCTTMTRMLAKTTAVVSQFRKVEAHLTSVKEKDVPQEKHQNLQIPKTDKVEVVINGFLEAVDRHALELEDGVHRINAKCNMNIRLEPKMEEPYLDMKQFIGSVIRKWQRVAFGWMMVQIVVITNNIDIEKASPALLQDAQVLKTMYDNDVITAEEYADRRLQILDKMFMRQRLIDREERTRWERDQINLKDVYGERKMALPAHYDREHTDFDYYDEEKMENEEVRRLRLLAIENDAAQQAKQLTEPSLVKNDLESEVYKRKIQAGVSAGPNRTGAGTVRTNVQAAQPKPDFQVAAPVVHEDLEARRRRYEEQQKEAERIRQERVAKGEASEVRPKPKPANAPMPSSAGEIDAYKRAMIERYEAQQRENAEILARKRQQG